ncbi:carbohydrate ABC transporter permease [Leifsonia sp. NPDC058194]|uniref:carbohydrate ABC transporter permease n=1 Tax=Leifsonia sp. NPDC058194 TaxID=3346374 RepID=UPI0036D8312A
MNDTEVAASPTRVARTPEKRKRKSKDALQASLIWAIPAVVLTLGIHYVAVGAGGVYAFTDWDGISASANFIGFDNFAEIFSDPTTRGALFNTLLIAVCFVIGSNVIGLSLAVALHRRLKSRFALRAFFFAPVVLSSLAVSYIWQYIFDYSGPLNGFLDFIGLGSLKQAWLGSPTFAIWTIIIVLIWQFSGQTMVIYIAGLEAIPDELNEAASVDGASGWARFRSVTFPLLAPSLTISLTLTLIIGLRVFDQIVALTGGGPVGASESLTTEIYKQAFVSGRFGYSSATALILTVLVLIIALLQLQFLQSRERKI